jgi:hypothetical protein
MMTDEHSVCAVSDLGDTWAAEILPVRKASVQRYLVATDPTKDSSFGIPVVGWRVVEKADE